MLKDHAGLGLGLASFLVTAAALWVSYIVPVTLDENARARDRDQACIEAVVDLRAAMQELSTGYAVGPGELAARLADWDRGEHAVDRARVTCRAVPLHTAQDVNTRSGLWEQVHTAHQAAFGAAPDLAPVNRVLDWTTAAVHDLTELAN